MSTRATYQFLGKQHRPTVTFYIHSDGYLEGAAEYFRNMVTEENQRGGLAEQFLRGNANAEFTGGHDTHGDTEYHYTVDGTMLNVRARSLHDDSWRGAFYGEIAEFINTYAEMKPGHYILTVGGRMMTELEAMTQLNRKLEEALHWSERGATGNSSATVNEAWKLYTALQKFDSETWKPAAQGVRNVIRSLDAKHAEAFGWKDGDGNVNVTKWEETFREGAQ